MKRVEAIEVVNRTGKYTFPDKTERYATERTKFVQDEPVVEIAETQDWAKVKFTLDGEILRQILNAAKTIVSEFQLKFGPKGMETTFVDPAHVAMGRVVVPRETFVEYDLGMRYLAVSVDVKRLRELLKKGKGLVSLEIRKLASKPHTDNMSGAGRKTVYISYEYSSEELYIIFNSVEMMIKTLDNNTIIVPRIPQISIDNYVIVSGAEVRAFLDRAAEVSESCRFSLNDYGLTMKSVSDDAEVKVVLERERLKELVLPDHRQIASSYPLEYLAKFFATMRSVDVKVSFKDDYPMSMEFPMNVGNPYLNINIVCLLAPRMEQ